MDNIIRVERARHRISQKDLAKAVGVSGTTINSVENNKISPSIIIAFKIAKYFNVKIEDIFFLTEDEIVEENKEHNVKEELTFEKVVMPEFVNDEIPTEEKTIIEPVKKRKEISSLEKKHIDKQQNRINDYLHVSRKINVCS
jgi:putative transcriptional regulator